MVIQIAINTSLSSQWPCKTRSAFDKNLNRLGYGGGYYDRLIEKLSKKKNIIKIGLAFSIQEIDKVPTNMYDQKLDYIVTNKNIIK